MIEVSKKKLSDSAGARWAALFVVAAALGVRCGSCFHAVWNQEREKAGLAMPMTEDTSGAVKVGIEAMKRIIAADKAKK